MTHEPERASAVDARRGCGRGRRQASHPRRPAADAFRASARAQTFARLLACVLLAALALSTGGCATQEWTTRPVEARAQCEACGQATDPEREGVRWNPDERVSCATCASTAVVDDAPARELLAEAREHLADHVGVEVQSHVSLSLVSRPELGAGAPELAHPSLRAYCQISEELRGDEVIRREFHVFALAGLPRDCLRGILVHELFHVAQAERSNDDGEESFREGGACWVQYRLHRHRGETLWAKQLESSSDPVYGRGLRRFLTLADSRGDDVTLRLALTTKRFPAGY